jgi:hypothetical protein
VAQVGSPSFDQFRRLTTGPVLAIGKGLHESNRSDGHVGVLRGHIERNGWGSMNNGRRRCAVSVRLAYAIGAGYWAMASAACSSGSSGPPDSGSSLDSGGSTDVIPEVDSAPSCPPSQSQPTCPVAPGAIDCARPEIGCGLDSLPTGLACSAPAQCSALIYSNQSAVAATTKTTKAFSVYLAPCAPLR